MSITPLPEAPSPLDPPDVFNAKAYAFFAALGVFSQEASDLAATIDFTAADIQSQAATAAVGGGASDAITASYTPAVSALSHGMLLHVRAAAANTTAAPTFSPGAGVAEKVIAKNNGAALSAGDITGAGHWLALQYDSTLDKWLLLNPAPPALVDSYTSTSLTEAPTANAVRVAYETGAYAQTLANSAQATANSAQATANNAFTTMTTWLQPINSGTTYHYLRLTRANGSYSDVRMS